MDTKSPNLSDRVAEEIRAVMGRRRLSGRALASLAGIPKSTVLRWLGGETPMSLTDLEAIARALNVPVVDLFPIEEKIAAGIPPMRTPALTMMPAADSAEATVDPLICSYPVAA